MSNIYIQEPPTHGKVLLETTVGDIDIELWSREAPKACRNFVQLCMEGYYNGTIFHRLVKGFIVQGGDPTGTGTGGNSIYGKPFKDEFHSRLRFVRRGLVGMANAGKDDNGSQFFFTLDTTPELQNKHTLFGKVAGNTIYNMIKLEESETNEDERPIYPHKIIGTKILLNPFEDIVPRQVIKRESKSKKEKNKETGTKNFKLLSFGEEAEEEEEEISVANKQYAGKSKSSHDLANDPKLSKELAVEPPPKKKRQQSGDSHSSADDSGADSGPEEHKKLSRRREDGESESASVDLSSIKEKLQRKSKAKPGKSAAGTVDADNDDGDYYLGKDEELAAKKRVDDLKKEYRELKSEMKKSERAKQAKEEAVQEKAGKLSESSDNSYIREFVSQQKEYKTKTAEAKKKGADREALTLALLQKFQKKLVNVQEPDDAPRETVEDEEDVNDSNWFTKPLDYEGDEAVLAKDANLKSAEWYGLDDPRNPVVQRRRNEAKRIAASKNHRRDLI